MRNTDSGLNHRTAEIQPMAISEVFCCPQTYHRVLLLSVIIRIHTYNTIHTQPSKRFRVHYPSTHVLTTVQCCTHTLTLSQRYTFPPYTKLTHIQYKHTSMYRKKENTKRNHDSQESGDISEILHTQYFRNVFSQ